jgi:predicted MFS family arabinose efflux permease
VRGGAIPIFFWGTLLLVLLIINAIWTGDSIQIEMFAYAVAAVWGTALALTIANSQARRRGPPVRDSSPEAVPQTSLAAMTLGIAIGAMMFGVVFGKFLVFIGGGVWLLAAGRLVVELRAQRRSLRGEEKEQ